MHAGSARWFAHKPTTCVCCSLCGATGCGARWWQERHARTALWPLQRPWCEQRSMHERMCGCRLCSVGTVFQEESIFDVFGQRMWASDIVALFPAAPQWVACLGADLVFGHRPVLGCPHSKVFVGRLRQFCDAPVRLFVQGHTAEVLCWATWRALDALALCELWPVSGCDETPKWWVLEIARRCLALPPSSASSPCCRRFCRR